MNKMNSEQTPLIINNHRKTRKIVNKSTGISDFPDEILINIFKILPSLDNIVLVNRRFFKLATDVHTKYQWLEYNHGDKYILIRMVKLNKKFVTPKLVKMVNERFIKNNKAVFPRFLFQYIVKHMNLKKLKKTYGVLLNKRLKKASLKKLQKNLNKCNDEKYVDLLLKNEQKPEAKKLLINLIEKYQFTPLPQLCFKELCNCSWRKNYFHYSDLAIKIKLSTNYEPFELFKTHDQKRKICDDYFLNNRWYDMNNEKVLVNCPNAVKETISLGKAVDLEINKNGKIKLNKDSKEQSIKIENQTPWFHFQNNCHEINEHSLHQNLSPL